MKNILLTPLAVVVAFISFSFDSKAQDTTWVQAYTWEEQNNPQTAYDSPGRRWFEFPASDNG